LALDYLAYLALTGFGFLENMAFEILKIVLLMIIKMISSNMVVVWWVVDVPNAV